MLHTQINLVRTPDKGKLEARLLPDQATLLDITAFNIVEDMTGRGRTGIIIEFQDAFRKKYFARTTARIIVNGVAPAGRGFMQSVNDNPDMP